MPGNFAAADFPSRGYAMANTFSWTGGVGSGTVIANWEWIAGSGNVPVPGPPAAGDTAIITAGTVEIPLDGTFVGNTVEIGGIGGAVAGLQFQGDAAISFSNPSLDNATLVESAVQGQAAAGQSLLQTLGDFVNQGTIDANGPTGSSFTIEVLAGSAGNAGAFINEGAMTIDAGNAMTIAVGTSAAFYNTNINVEGGSLLLTTLAAGAIDGGLAPISGVVVMSRTASVEDNIAYGTGVSGAPPVFAFADSTDTLKLDQQAQFGGLILNFTAGDTIDLGKGLIVNGDSYNSATGVLSLLDNTTIVSSLIMAGGDYSNTSFQTGAAGNGDLLLTTTGTDVSWNNGTGGSFGTGTNWVGGSPPGTTAAVAIGLATPVIGTITVGGSHSVQSLLLVGNSETLAVGGSLGVTGALIQGGASIDVTSAATLDAAILQQIGGGYVQVGGGAEVTLAGVASLGFANAGTLTGSTSGNVALLLQGGGFIGGTLSAGGFTDIGEEGGGTPAQVTVVAGGVVSDTYALLNSGPTSFGSLTLTGSGASWTDAGSATDPNNLSGFMEIGVSPISGRLPAAGAAGLTVTQNAILTEQGSGGRGGFARIGYQIDTSGIANVSSGGVWNIGLAGGGFLQVGAFGTGTLDIAGGTVAVGGNGTYVANGSTFSGGGIGIGRFAGGVGTVVVDGGALSSAGGIAVGNAGTGTLTVLNGGTVLTSTGGIGIGVSSGAVGVAEVQSGGSLLLAGTGSGSGLGLGNTAGAVGTLVVSGAGALVSLGTTTTGIGIGNGGSGLLEIGNGGTVSLAAAGIGVAISAGASGTLVVGGGGVLSLGAGATNGIGIGAGNGVIDVLAGGTITDAAIGGNDISFGSTGTLEGNGLIQATVSDGGTILATGGGTLEIAYSVLGTGNIDVASNTVLQLDQTLGASGAVAIGAGGTLALETGVNGTASFSFAGSGAAGEMVLRQPGAGLSNAVQNLSGGDIIALGSFTSISSATYSGSVITVTGVLNGNSTTYQLTDVGFAGGSSTTLIETSVIDPSSGGTVQAIEVACYAAGTRLRGAQGEIAVERLRPGDLLRTAGGALRPVRWIGHRRIDLTRHPDPRRAQPIRIAADAFADGVPTRDLWLSPDHAVFDRGRLIPIRLLVNGATIVRETRRRTITYYHVELDTHDLLLAEGLPAESYLDCDNRGIFENAPEPLILHPDFYDPAAQAARRLATSCAPLADAADLVAPLWWRLADRAVALGFLVPAPSFTHDPALAVRTASGLVMPEIGADGSYRFALPAGPATLVSRAAYPQDATPWLEDQRRLGVMVRALKLGGTPLPLDHPALTAGWWAPETDGTARWRWTDGAAALGTLTAPAILEVTLGDTIPYPRQRRAA